MKKRIDIQRNNFYKLFKELKNHELDDFNFGRLSFYYQQEFFSERINIDQKNVLMSLAFLLNIKNQHQYQSSQSFRQNKFIYDLLDPEINKTNSFSQFKLISELNNDVKDVLIDINIVNKWINIFKNANFVFEKETTLTQSQEKASTDYEILYLQNINFQRLFNQLKNQRFDERIFENLRNDYYESFIDEEISENQKDVLLSLNTLITNVQKYESASDKSPFKKGIHYTLLSPRVDEQNNFRWYRKVDRFLDLDSHYQWIEIFKNANFVFNDQKLYFYNRSNLLKSKLYIQKVNLNEIIAKYAPLQSGIENDQPLNDQDYYLFQNDDTLWIFNDLNNNYRFKKTELQKILNYYHLKLSPQFNSVVGFDDRFNRDYGFKNFIIQSKRSVEFRQNMKKLLKSKLWVFKPIKENPKYINDYYQATENDQILNPQNIYYFSDQGNIFSDQNRKFRFSSQEIQNILDEYLLDISEDHTTIIEKRSNFGHNFQNDQSIEKTILQDDFNFWFNKLKNENSGAHYSYRRLVELRNNFNFLFRKGRISDDQKQVLKSLAFLRMFAKEPLLQNIPYFGLKPITDWNNNFSHYQLISQNQKIALTKTTAKRWIKLFQSSNFDISQGNQESEKIPQILQPSIKPIKNNEKDQNLNLDHFNYWFNQLKDEVSGSNFSYQKLVELRDYFDLLLKKGNISDDQKQVLKSLAFLRMFAKEPALQNIPYFGLKPITDLNNNFSHYQLISRNQKIALTKTTAKRWIKLFQSSNFRIVQENQTSEKIPQILRPSTKPIKNNEKDQNLNLDHFNYWFNQLKNEVSGSNFSYQKLVELRDYFDLLLKKGNISDDQKQVLKSLAFLRMFAKEPALQNIPYFGLKPITDWNNNFSHYQLISQNQKIALTKTTAKRWIKLFQSSNFRIVQENQASEKIPQILQPSTKPIKNNEKDQNLNLDHFNYWFNQLKNEVSGSNFSYQKLVELRDYFDLLLKKGNISDDQKQVLKSLAFLRMFAKEPALQNIPYFGLRPITDWNNNFSHYQLISQNQKIALTKTTAKRWIKLFQSSNFRIVQENQASEKIPQILQPSTKPIKNTQKTQQISEEEIEISSQNQDHRKEETDLIIDQNNDQNNDQNENFLITKWIFIKPFIKFSDQWQNKKINQNRKITKKIYQVDNVTKNPIGQYVSLILFFPIIFLSLSLILKKFFKN